MLRSVTLRNFKSFVDETTPIAPFTLLVGVNGSGKSNFIDALRYLHGLSFGWTLREVATGVSGGDGRVWSGIRGGTRELVRSGSTGFAISSDWQIQGDGHLHTIDTDGTSLHSEQVDNLVYATHAPAVDHPGEDMMLEWPSHGMAGPGAPSHGRAPADRSVLTHPSGWRSQLRGDLRELLFLDLLPSAMRDYTERLRPTERPRLAADGRNLSAVLESLCTRPGMKDEIVDWLVELCAPEIADLEFQNPDPDSVMLRIRERSGVVTTARAMSDGTLRFLAILAALRTSNSTLVVEDLDHGLHPQRLRLLVDAITSIRRPDAVYMECHNVIATTHSPALVEAALDAPHTSVLLFARRPDLPGTIIRDVRSLPEFDAVRKRRDFSYLVNTGWLERAV